MFRLADLQTQKQKLTRLISRYEEDVDYERQRAENMQQEIAKADRTRREVRATSVSSLSTVPWEHCRIHWRSVKYIYAFYFSNRFYLSAKDFKPVNCVLYIYY